MSEQNGAAPDEFDADLDAEKPLPMRIHVQGRTYPLPGYRHIPSDTALEICRHEKTIASAKTAEAVIEGYREIAALLMPTLPKEVLGSLSLEQLQHIGKLSYGTARPRKAAGPASSSILPEPPASTAGVTETSSA